MSATAKSAAVCLALNVLVLVAAAPSAYARIGLSTRFVDVEVEGLRPGGVYNLRELRGAAYALKNRGDGPIDVAVEVQVPESLMPHYEAIPDPAWIELTPRVLRIDPGTLGSSEIVIRIPNEPALDGRHFQVTLSARTLGAGLFGAGVNSRLRFSIGPGPGAAAPRGPTDAVMKLEYDLRPKALSLSKAKTGTLYDGKRAEGRRFLLKNRSGAELRLALKAVRWPVGALPLPAGRWKTPEDLSWVRFEPAVATVGAFASREVRMVLDKAPDSLRGGKAAFLVELRLPDGRVVERTHRGFITFPTGGGLEKKGPPWRR
ncbi:MAG: hypothetical protein FD126_2156 [Elusimicrobia bacterium]|nr:MAG: hypothetical protein FD126_2156 [Elusimicrobiota bacterium]